MILFIDACARNESRSRKLAETYLSRCKEEVKRINLLDMEFPKVNEEFITFRNDCCSRKDFSSAIFEPAKDFARADEFVIAVPFYDLSFASVLKQYLEQICIVNLTFYYDENNMPQSLCRARKARYFTTAGGPFFREFGSDYVECLLKTFFGVDDYKLYYAENLDIVGNDPDQIMNEAISQIEADI